MDYIHKACPFGPSYAHLAPNHLTQHAMQIDSFLAGNGTNMAQGAFAELVTSE